MSLRAGYSLVPSEKDKPSKGRNKEDHGHREAIWAGVCPGFIPGQVWMLPKMDKAIEEVFKRPTGEQKEEPAESC